MLDELAHPGMVDLIEKCSNVKVEHPIHFPARSSDVERVQRIVLVAPRSKTVRESHKVLLPNLAEDRSHHVLNDFVFQRRDPQWSLPPIGFGNPDSSRRLRPIRPAVDPPM